MRRAILAILSTAALLGLSAAYSPPASAAVQGCDGGNAYVELACAYASDGGVPTYYWGWNQSADSNCVYVERRNTSGSWARTGFQLKNSSGGWTTVPYAASCGGQLTWRVYNGADTVTGIRFVKGSYWTSNHCLGANDCHTLLEKPLP